MMLIDNVKILSTVDQDRYKFQRATKCNKNQKPKARKPKPKIHNSKSKNQKPKKNRKPKSQKPESQKGANPRPTKKTKEYLKIYTLPDQNHRIMYHQKPSVHAQFVSTMRGKSEKRMRDKWETNRTQMGDKIETGYK